MRGAVGLLCMSNGSCEFAQYHLQKRDSEAPAFMVDLSATDAGGTASRIESIIALATTHPNLDAFVRCNSGVFLNPANVGGDVRAPLAVQFAYFLRSAAQWDDEHLNDIEYALRTGVVKGLARGEPLSDDDDDAQEEDLQLLAENWREDDVNAWAALLRCEAAHARGCLITPDGSHCVGPLPLQEWLESCLPQAVDRLQRALSLLLPSGSGEATCTSSEGGRDKLACARDAATRLCGVLTRAVDAELAARVSGGDELRPHLRSLLLTVHCMGEVGASEPWLIQDARDAALSCAHAAVSRMAEGGCTLEEPAGPSHVALRTELSCIAFLASLVARQEAQAHRAEAQLAKDLRLSEDAHAASLDDGWSGDDEDRSANALCALAVGLAEHGRSY